MNYDIIRIGMEAELSLELHRLFQGQVIEKVIQDAKVEPESDHSKDLLGNDFKISARMAPGLYKLCQEVLARLKFKKKTEFFVFNSSEVDCFALPSFENEQSHLIMITSGMIERFDEDELRFILGHEIGHLLSNNSMLHKIIRFIFPNLKKAPLVFQNKISLWKKLAEFTADRYGYIASPNLEKCVTCFYKLASGLNVKRFEFNPQNYLEEMEEILEFFKNEPYASHSTHPINPLRIKAIELFNQSQLYQQILNKKN